MSGGTSEGVEVTCDFDAGNIEVVDSSSISNVSLKVRADPYTELEKKAHKQWFYFRASGGIKGKEVTYNLQCGDCSYAYAFIGTTVVYSTDRKEWKRVAATSFDKASGVMTWKHAAPSDVCWYAYFAPYSHEQHQDLVAACASSPLASVRSIGKTLDQRSLDMVTVGEGPLKVWVIHRQHPGESQAEWFAEGLLGRLLGLEGGGQDGLVRSLLRDVTFHIIPSMNPDGAARGHLRTNACGANLNREWASTGDYQAPTLERSPEVYYTLREMDATGVDAFVDVHGDEAMPYNFIAGGEGCPNWNQRMKSLQGLFVRAYERSNPDMQSKYSYEPDEAGKANLAICSNQVCSRFDCLGVTLEMPFKDCKSNPDPVFGWSPARSKALGRSLVDAIAYSKPYLRAEGSFWETLPEWDAYICPVESKVEGESA